MRFLLDMNFSPRVTEWQRVQGHDAVHVHEQGHGNWDDRAIFNTAIEDRRIVLTFDLDFGDIVAAAEQNMVGVILVRLRSMKADRVIERLSSVLAAADDALEQGAIVIVEDARMRVRRLPIGR